MIQGFADWLVYEAFNLNRESNLGSAVNFFFYDTIKIIILLFLISSVMGILNAYFPIEKLKKYLASHKLYGLEYFLAAFLGAVTPFCSCSSVPLFIGFVKGGIPLGVTFAFLISSPLISEIAVAMFLGTFGLKISIIYVVSGMILSMIGGYVLGKMKLERFLTQWVKDIQANSEKENQIWREDKTSFFKRLPSILRESFGVVRGVFIYILIGIGIGAVMHGYVPENFFSQFMTKGNLFAVPISVILAAPIYANAAGIVPIVEVFVAKGIPLGTAIAFMMSVITLSLPEATMLKKVMTLKLIGIFFGTVTLFIILSGYFFNLVL